MRLQAEEQMLQEAELNSSPPPGRCHQIICVDVIAEPSTRSQSQARLVSMVSSNGAVGFHLSNLLKIKPPPLELKPMRYVSRKPATCGDLIHADKLPADPKVETEVAGAIPTLVLRLLNGLNIKAILCGWTILQFTRPCEDFEI
ncbi:hypothetical protein EVAR_94771_1 [Eumeta japonica]|uniref:Uncharacterized protein n=1 Tax=Eumeta variegata TaxID=151549 RepID=A0A4C2AFW9_EUMVA|nr:hypothetical protein EVAR_94771_1 [Eumeta japonica]